MLRCIINPPLGSRNGDGLIDFDEFQKLNKRYPLILFPCFRLQSRIHKTTLSEKHWLKLAKRYCTQLKLQEYKVSFYGPVLSEVV